MKKTEHGANLFEISSKYGFELSKIMDFSSNINPFGASPKALSQLTAHPDLVSIYPDPAYTDLKQAVEDYTGASADHILLGSGATSLISGFIKKIAPKNALLQKPAYSEYEKELRKNQAVIHEYLLSANDDFRPSAETIIQLSKKHHCELIVLCNPNNPTGSLLRKEEINHILQQTDAYLMVDETYIEFTDVRQFSCSTLVNDHSRLFVIRGTSKFFSTPGIRLGYALCSDPVTVESLNKDHNLWDINIFADRLGSVMFRDADYHKKTFELIAAQRSYLLQELASFEDFKVYSSYGNFILSQIVSKRFTAKELYDALLPKKIIIRNCQSFDGLSEYFFRVCTLKPEENRLLIAAISEFIASK